jgi:hypothetical protein
MSAMGVIERVLADVSLPMERIERAFDLRKQLKAEYAEMAFKRALAQMQPELPTIDKNGRIEVRAKDAKGERTGAVQQSTAFADWADINDTIKPILGNHGFALSFVPSNAADGRITMMAILDHREGFSRTAEFSAAYDTTGSKNNIQGAGSTMSYLKRYLGCALLNITSRAPMDRDKDGSDPITVITDEQVKELADEIAATKSDEKGFLGFFKVESLAELPAAKLEQARKMLAKKKRGANGDR